MEPTARTSSNDDARSATVGGWGLGWDECAADGTLQKAAGKAGVDLRARPLADGRDDASAAARLPQSGRSWLSAAKSGANITGDHLSQNINYSQGQHHACHQENRKTHAFCLNSVVIFDDEGQCMTIRTRTPARGQDA